MPLTIIPEVVQNQTIHSLLESNTAHDAALVMEEHDVSTVIVVDNDEKLIGIVTERDITRRVVAKSLQAHEAKLKDIMTRDLQTLSADNLAFEAVECMRRHKIRHLPVVDDGRVIGMVSMRDLRHSIAAYSYRHHPNLVIRAWRQIGHRFSRR